MTDQQPEAAPETEEVEEIDEATRMLNIMREVNSLPDAIKRTGDRVTISFNDQSDIKLREVQKDVQLNGVTIPVFMALDDNNAMHNLSLQCADLQGAPDQTLKSVAGQMLFGVQAERDVKVALRDEIHTTLRTAQNVCKPE